MRTLYLVLAALGLLAGAAVGQYHDPVYLMGGYASTSTLYWNGVWVADARNQTVKHLTPNQLVYRAYTMTMDADNQRVLFTAEGSTSSSYSSFLRSGIFRVDPNTLAISTVLSDTMALFSPRRLIVNQDGDYVVTVYQSNPTNYAVLKLSGAGANVTTILDSTKLGTSSYATTYSVGRSMDTGLYLVNLYQSGAFYYTVLEVDDNGVFTTFGGGPTSSMYGWYNYYYAPIEQNLDNGAIEGLYSRVYYQLARGAATRSTLYNVGYPGGYSMPYGSRFDLQTAPTKRLVAPGYFSQSVASATSYLPAALYVDAQFPYAASAVNLDPMNSTGLRYHYPYGFDFYRGRHLQTIKVGPKQWDLRISCPSHAGKTYVAGVSLSGYRPGLRLKDGRKINLVPDQFTGLSAQGLLRPFFDPGPQHLDANGLAVGHIDLGWLPKLGGVPMWIAVAVLDAGAPNGVAYLPDTYVFRIP